MKIRIPLVICSSVIMILGCSCDPRDTGNPAESTITYGLPGFDETFMNSSDSPGLIMSYPPFRQEGYEIKGLLVEKWEHTPDYKTWTFHLRKDIKWHDGVPFTAHDVKFTKDLYVNPAIFRARRLYAVNVVDYFTYTYEFPEITAYARAPFDVWDIILPKHLLENLDPKDYFDWEFWDHPVGIGPYKYVRHVPKTMMELEANPDFFLGKPKIDRLILRFTGASEITELLSGNVDMGWLNSTDLSKLKVLRDFRIYFTEEEAVKHYIWWNLRDPLFKDKRVRKAVTMAINRQELHKVLDIPGECRIIDSILTMRQYRANEIPEPLAFDPDRARSLLSEAGWTDTNGDGILDDGKQAFRFTISVSSAYYEKAAVYMQASLKKIGILAEVQSIAWGVNRGMLQNGTYQVSINPYRWAIHNYPSTFEEESKIAYMNPEVSELAAAYQKSIDPDEIIRIERRLTQIIYDEQPMTFLFTSKSAFIAHKKIKGIPNPLREWPDMMLGRLWIEEKE